MVEMLWGATAMGCVVVAGFFLRFWSRSRDVLFLLFALGFFALAVNWVGLAAVGVHSSGGVQVEARHWFFVVRLVAFLLFLGAILWKNLGPRPTDRS